MWHQVGLSFFEYQSIWLDIYLWRTQMYL